MDTSSCLDGSLKRRGAVVAEWWRTLGKGGEKKEKNSTDVTRSLFIYFFEVDLCKCDVHTPGGSTRLVHLCRQLKRSLPGWTLSCV